MTTKYNLEIDNQIILTNLKRIINQVYKLLPNKEEGIEWKIPLDTIIEELAGMSSLFMENLGPDFLMLLSKLEGLKNLEEDFFNFRRTIFECLNLLNRVKEYVKTR